MPSYSALDAIRNLKRRMASFHSQTMAGPSTQFKKLLLEHDRMSRDRILYRLSQWLFEQQTVDPQAAQCSSVLQMLCNDNGYQTDAAFQTNMNWMALLGSDTCVSLRRIVEAGLAVPPVVALTVAPVVALTVAPVATAEKKPRRAIPKRIRGLVWKAHFGEAMTGGCYCCKKVLEALDDWHAGHIVAHANGGRDNVENLRPLCVSCNLSMGTENMDEFKRRCYVA